jgi:hypothetical protein
MAEDGPPADPASENLNYLQIESFMITRHRSGDVVAADLANARRFLADRGIETFARQHSNGFVLYTMQGFPMEGESAARREALKRRVEELGREYRRSGGLYEFKGCHFVSHSRATAGRPVTGR